MKLDQRRPFFISMLASLVLVGCVQNVRPYSANDAELFSPRAVYFSTNRNATGKENLNKRFGSERSELQWGVSTVAIPNDYPKAHSTSFVHWNLPLKRNPEKYLAVLDSQVLAETDFFARVNRDAHAKPKNQALVFIHGYNVTFERATRISAKLAYDLDLQGPSLLFSWPSEESTAKYTVDEVNLQWTQPAFNAFLSQLFAATDIEKVYLIAHSLGNRALTEALIDVLAKHPEYAQRIGGVVLAAPDMDAAVFARDIAPKLIAYELPITLYVSSRDLALVASGTLHGYPRAGEAGDSIVILPGMDTVDASDAEAEVFGHEYFYQGAHTIADIYQWLIEGKSVNDRANLSAIENDQGRYWRIVPSEIQ